MHPEILRELSAQRGRDMRAQARRALLGRAASKARRARRRGLGEADVFAVPAIPDYVDGSFAVTQAGDRVSDDQPGRVASTGRAA